MRNHPVVVWLDQHEAKIFDLSAEPVEADRVLALRHHVRRSETTREPRLDSFEHHYFQDVAHALADAGEVLVVGPGKAKLAFLKFVHAHAHALEPRIVGVETVDHPTDGQLVAYARTYFGAPAPRVAGR
jgi:stalled ribosome rescue protein Dom34